MNDSDLGKPNDNQTDNPLEMFVEDALPLIMEKYGVDESEAYWMWRNYQSQKPQPGPDVVEMDSPEIEARIEEMNKKPDVMRFSLKMGKRTDNVDKKTE